MFCKRLKNCVLTNASYSVLVKCIDPKFGGFKSRQLFFFYFFFLFTQSKKKKKSFGGD